MSTVINISMYLSYLLEAYIAYMYFGAMFEQRYKSSVLRIILYITGFSLLYPIIFFESPVLNMIFSIAVMLTLGCLVFKSGVLKSLFHSVVVAGLLVGSETFVIALFNMVFTVNAAGLKTPAIVVIVSISSKILLFMICKVISLFAEKDKSADKRIILLFLVPVASMLCMLIIFYQSGRLELNSMENVLNCLVSLLLLGTNLLVFYVYERSLKNEQELSRIRLLEQRRELDCDYYRMLEETRNESRIIIHDIKHHLELIRCIAQENGDENIKDYVDSIQKASCFSKPCVLSGHRVVDAILSQKYLMCKNKGISFSFEHNNTDLGFVSAPDLCVLISNAMDNAIEAVQNSKDKVIEVSFYPSENNSFCFLEFVNSCDVKPRRNNRGFISTKKGKYHGIGLYSMQQTAEKYGGEMVLQYTDDKKFRTTIMLQRD